MRFSTVSVPLTIAAALLFSTSGAFAQSRLGSAADSLEDSLKALNKEFERRGDRFRDSAGSLFRTLDKSRSAADRLDEEASKNKPRWQLQSIYQDLRGHMNDLTKELSRFSLTRDERRAADAVRWNQSLTVAAWERYGGSSYPVRQTAPFDRFERARTYATRYLTSKYRVPARDLNIGRVTEAGRILRVRVGVKGVGVRLVDVDPRNGAILADRRD